MCCGLLASAVAQETASPLAEWLVQPTAAASVPAVSPEQRAAVFSAMASLPADTDSFFAIRGLGDYLGNEDFNALAAGFPAVSMVAGLDGFALGLSEAAVKDLQRMLPLFSAIVGEQPELADEWLEKAVPDAGLVIVAQQREARQYTTEQLLEASRHAHLAPVYMVLSSRPESVSLLHTISMLPLMMPADPSGLIEPVMQENARGFCVRCDKFDWDEAELPADIVARIRQNLSQTRLYVTLHMVRDSLVLAVYTNPQELHFPESAAASVLGTARMHSYDSLMHAGACAMGLSSAALVNLRENLNLQAYRGAARFMGGVFRNLVSGQPAAAAVDRLLQTLVTLSPDCRGAEKIQVWKDGDYYVEFTADASGLSFEPGKLGVYPYANQQGTIFFAQGTPLRGMPEIDAAAVIDDVLTVQNGYLDTLNPVARADAEADLETFRLLSPALKSLAVGLAGAGRALGGESALLLQWNPLASGVVQAVPVALRVSLGDSAAYAEAEKHLVAAGDSLYALLTEREKKELQQELLAHVSVERAESALVVKNGSDALTPAGAPDTIEVPGGMVFTLRLAELGDALSFIARKNHDSDLNAAAADISSAAEEIQRIDGAVSTQNNRLRVRLRVRPVSK